MDEALKHAEGWSTSGHKWIGEKVRRMFDAEVGGAADGGAAPGWVRSPWLSSSWTQPRWPRSDWLG